MVLSLGTIKGIIIAYADMKIVASTASMLEEPSKKKYIENS